MADSSAFPDQQLLAKRILEDYAEAGGGKSSIAGGAWRPQPRSQRSAIGTPSRSMISRGSIRSKSSSELRLETGSSRASYSSYSRTSTGKSSVNTSDSMWETMAPFNRVDRVAHLLQQPLPVRGMKDFEETKRTMPQAPTHLAVVLSEQHDSHNWNEQMEQARATQKNPDLWRGYGRDDFTEYT
eukprot:CAMPEP_0206492338 /NCGR_PEP_ID=MMETSP0324_2-20121206/45982_1 /ASSEMBLY_ACC=CAM_ASM_000836 /TAXON_ID=2866 /ORGANISM="Crypthecodinium cohnii, Strain Seligo" /LENGTH=183 /DNA_ID=CAMNT_0053974601 /DNA_START=39 /DNA_END=587 /DNA_ORIENTATION=-